MSIYKKLISIFSNDENKDNQYNLIAADILLPRSSVVFLDINEPDEIEKVFINSDSFLLPVCDCNLDDIVGCYSVLDFLNDKQNNQKLYTSIHPVFYIPSNTEFISILNLLFQKKTKLIVVVDGFGGTEGIITRHTLLHDFFERIGDREYSSEGQVIFKGQIPIFEIFTPKDIEGLEHISARTVGGLIVEKLGNVPKIGEIVTIGKYEIQIIDADSRKINKLSIKTLK